MVVNRLHIWREYRLVEVIHVHSRISPQMETLRQWSGIEQADADFQERFARVKGQPERAFEMPHRFEFTQPKRRASIRIFGDGVIDRAISTGAMVLWPVELDATGKPRASQANQRRFD